MATPAYVNWQIHDTTGRRKYLTGSEVSRFLEIASRRTPKQRALCFLLAYSGCRITEALELTRHQVNPDQMAVTFRTLKRRRLVFRTVPVPEFVIEQLLDLPPGEQGLLWTVDRTTAWRHIKQVMAMAGIVGPMASPKGLRHGLGIRAASNCVPANVVQRWLGHASPRTTAIYMDAIGSEERTFAIRMWKSLST
jgi:integrase/recombinase XerD